MEGERSFQAEKTQAPIRMPWAGKNPGTFKEAQAGCKAGHRRKNGPHEAREVG